MSLIYTKEQLGEKYYKVTTTINNIEHTFHCVVANDTQEDLDELVQWNIDQIDIPEVVYEPTYADKRKAEYPPIEDYLDAVVKGDQEAIDAYIVACQVVKDKYPKN
jgi:uncharacterized protein (DUF2344 family)